ncbi:error-prone DNA polymerase domain protein [Mycobacterium xenopi 4042]|uniref:Error-prone DNA polymerase domain protein n=1 Tax=Mycobacterium xenopi 4042 TaxID=1299334 RepID=X7YK46_MYCXE|nr:error-prone DNA polymerase domain protein [Mycobacterium xenopi 4042]
MCWPVEEAVGRMGMQLGVADRGTDGSTVAGWLICSALARPWAVIRGSAGVPERRACRAATAASGFAALADGLAGQHPLHFRPTGRPIAPPHASQYIERMFEIRTVGWRPPCPHPGIPTQLSGKSPQSALAGRPNWHVHQGHPGRLCSGTSTPACRCGRTPISQN